MTLQEALNDASFPWERDDEYSGKELWRVTSSDGGRFTAAGVYCKPVAHAGLPVTVYWMVFQHSADGEHVVAYAEGQSVDAQLSLAACEHTFKVLVQRALDAEAKPGVDTPT